MRLEVQPFALCGPCITVSVGGGYRWVVGEEGGVRRCADMSITQPVLGDLLGDKMSLEADGEEQLKDTFTPPPPFSESVGAE